jgi:hypothetical protein
MASTHAHCPAAGPRCGYNGILLVCSIGVHPYVRLLVDWLGWLRSGWGLDVVWVRGGEAHESTPHDSTQDWGDPLFISLCLACTRHLAIKCPVVKYQTVKKFTHKESSHKRPCQFFNTTKKEPITRKCLLVCIYIYIYI